MDDEYFLTVAGVGFCVLIVYIAYCMLFARAAGHASQRLPPAAIPIRARRSLAPPSTTTSTFSPPPTRRHSTLHAKTASSSMLRGAVQKHEKENAPARHPSQHFMKSSPPEGQAPNGSQTSNPGYCNPLKQSTSALNGARGWQQPSANVGMKRTASGLAKACDGAFDDGPGSRQKPIPIGNNPVGANKRVQVAQNEFVDENDFDSDIDLDVEEPLPKKASLYPSIPQQTRAAPPPQPLVYPTLPRQQQVQSNADVESEYSSVDPSAVKSPPRSSAPAPWSSSPAEHFVASKPFSVQSFAYDAGAQPVQNGPPPPQAQTKPAKRRTLPWLDDKAAKADTASPYPTAAAMSKAAKSSGTPLSKGKSMYPWNTTASAIKEQQKQHREDTKRSMKKNEPDEDSLRKAKSAQQRPAKVFLSE